MYLKKIIGGANWLACLIIADAWMISATAQQPKPEDPAPETYRETPARINDLVHTRIDVRFDYKKCYLYGKEWVTLNPHYYPTDSLRLDAKGMDIKDIAVVKSGKTIPLKFTYDDQTIAIKLDKVYQNTEKYTLCIDYISKPNELKVKENAKGLYFVNPDGSEKDKPTQIWTEGEPESSSVWFPTIDKPNQKTTEEIRMTVPARYITLSNGRLAAQKLNADDTRTDTWKMELPHAPYLFMMAVGDFRIYKDSWHGKEVSYYLEPKYAPFAKDIFGLTPEAIDFFSKTLGVDYPWNKYSQIMVRDYISGAMENTTATLMGDPAQSSKREFVDSNYNPGLEHELFHQWFGDYVTAESWSNITLNESFADFGEIIWLEHKYGKDVAGEHVQDGLQGYLNSSDGKKLPLVNFHYKTIKEAFGVAYQKGGRILNMLRNYIGEAAFYKGLHIYLTTNAFKSAEAQQLRLAMEEVSGLDLNWFFNQWYYRAGHPELNISYAWDDSTKTQIVYLQQTQDGAAFILPMALDIYAGGTKERHTIWMRDKTDSFTFKVASRPDLVNVDADRILVAQKIDKKTASSYYFQYFHAPLYQDRNEAIETAKTNQDDKGAQKVLIAALTDKYSGLRRKAIIVLSMNGEDIRNVNADLRNAALPILVTLAQKDNNTLVRAAAIYSLVKLRDPTYKQIFMQALNSQSYEVQAAALTGISELDPVLGMRYAKDLEKDNEGELTQAIARVYASNGGPAEWPFVYKKYASSSLQDQIHLTSKLAALLDRIDNPVYAQQGIEALRSVGVKWKAAGVGPYISKFLHNIKEQRTKLNDAASAKAAADAIKQIDGAN